MTFPYGFVDTCCEKHDNCYLDKDDMTPKQEAALDVALEALENSRGLEPVDVQWVKGQRKAAINLLKEVRK